MSIVGLNFEKETKNLRNKMPKREKRSLALKAEGLIQAKAALKRVAQDDKNVLARLVGRSRATIQSFYTCKPIGLKSFKAICEVLGMDWYDAAGLSRADSPEASAIEEIVRSMRQQIEPLIREKCSKLRVLDIERPMKLGEVDTRVKIRERISGRQGLKLSELWRETDPQQFESLGLGQVRSPRVPGLEALDEHSKVLILGKPGAGKTTFLKHVAIECIDSWFQKKQVPLFVFLKDFAEAEAQPDLLTYINQSLVRSQDWQQILAAGKALILLDGLDEVTDADSSRVVGEIRKLSEQFPENRFAITCRTAKPEYAFEEFVEIEIADFDDEQIAGFCGRWFRGKDDLKQTPHFLEKLEAEPSKKKLTSSPLLAILLCLVFDDSESFPSNYTDLYETGIDVLLTKWDADRNIEGDRPYRDLSLRRKKDMLGRIARTTFEAGKYFCSQQELEGYAKDYIQNLTDASTDPEALDLDSAATLKSMEAQHGVLIERAQGIYSFLHPTFHEYFTARKIVATCNPEAEDDPTLQGLVEHLTEKRWQEVFLLSAEMLDSADVLLKSMKDRIDGLLAEDEKLQEFLSWVNQKSLSVEVPYKSAAVRGFYFGLALAEAIDRQFAYIFDFNFAFNSDLLLDLDIAIALDLDFDLHLDLDLDLAQGLNPELAEELQRLKAKLPDSDSPNPDGEDPDGDEDRLQQWKETEGKAWTEELKAIAIKHRNICHDWQFDEEQKKLLDCYYDANKLLVDCLNTDCYVSREVRQEIEESLLLPAR